MPLSYERSRMPRAGAPVALVALLVGALLAAPALAFAEDAEHSVGTNGLTAHWTEETKELLVYAAVPAPQEGEEAPTADLDRNAWLAVKGRYKDVASVIRFRHRNVEELERDNDGTVDARVRFPENSDNLFANVKGQILFDKGAIDTSRATSMSFMFYECAVANPDVEDWDTSKVTEMSYMFLNASKANPQVAKWNVSKVVRLDGIFQAAYEAKPDVSEWKLFSVRDMYASFNAIPNADLDISRWEELPANVELGYSFSTLSAGILTLRGDQLKRLVGYGEGALYLNDSLKYGILRKDSQLRVSRQVFPGDAVQGPEMAELVNSLDDGTVYEVRPFIPFGVTALSTEVEYGSRSFTLSMNAHPENAQSLVSGLPGVEWHHWYPVGTVLDVGPGDLRLDDSTPGPYYWVGFDTNGATVTVVRKPVPVPSIDPTPIVADGRPHAAPLIGGEDGTYVAEGDVEATEPGDYEVTLKVGPNWKWKEGEPLADRTLAWSLKPAAVPDPEPQPGPDDGPKPQPGPDDDPGSHPNPGPAPADPDPKPQPGPGSDPGSSEPTIEIIPVPAPDPKPQGEPLLAPIRDGAPSGSPASETALLATPATADGAGAALAAALAAGLALALLAAAAALMAARRMGRPE